MHKVICCVVYPYSGAVTHNREIWMIQYFAAETQTETKYFFAITDKTDFSKGTYSSVCSLFCVFSNWVFFLTRVHCLQLSEVPIL
jgi:hypothetical protein